MSEGNREGYQDNTDSTDTCTKCCQENTVLLNAIRCGAAETLLANVNHVHKMGVSQPYSHQAAPGFAGNKAPSRESMTGDRMDGRAPMQPMEVNDHNGVDYTKRQSTRTLQRHHTIQTSEDAYDQAELSGMSLLAGKVLSSARMSDVLSQSSLTGSQQLQNRESEEHDGCSQSSADLNPGEGSHSNSSCYPAKCITDILKELNPPFDNKLRPYKHPDLGFGMEQAGV